MISASVTTVMMMVGDGENGANGGYPKKSADHPVTKDSDNCGERTPLGSSFWDPPRPLSVLQAQRAGSLTTLMPRDPRGAKKRSAIPPPAATGKKETAIPPSIDVQPKRPLISTSDSQGSRNQQIIDSIFNKPGVHSASSSFLGAFNPPAKLMEGAPPPPKVPRSNGAARPSQDYSDLYGGASSRSSQKPKTVSSPSNNATTMTMTTATTMKRKAGERIKKMATANSSPPRQAPSTSVGDINRGGDAKQHGSKQLFVPKVICKYWMEGKCYKGSMCTFSHAVDPHSSRQSCDDEVVKVQNIPGLDGHKREDICNYYRLGHCLRGAHCLYSHDLSGTPCKYFHLNGRCKDGPACRFSHASLTDATRLVLERELQQPPAMNARPSNNASSIMIEGNDVESAMNGPSSPALIRQLDEPPGDHQATEPDDDLIEEDLIRSLVNPMYHQR